jgi:hypothetical protein
MTDHHPQPAGPPATARQQRYLRQLATKRGVTCVVPRTRAEASRAIDALKRRAPESVAHRRRELRAVQDDIARGRGDDARIVEGVETTGYVASQRDLEGTPRMNATEQGAKGATNERVELGRYTIAAASWQVIPAAGPCYLADRTEERLAWPTGTTPTPKSAELTEHDLAIATLVGRYIERREHHETPCVHDLLTVAAEFGSTAVAAHRACLLRGDPRHADESIPLQP